MTDKKFKSVRLNSWNRPVILRHFQSLLVTEAEEAAETEAHLAAIEAVRRLVEPVMPTADIEVLHRYGNTKDYTGVTLMVTINNPDWTEDGEEPQTVRIGGDICLCPRDHRSTSRGLHLSHEPEGRPTMRGPGAWDGYSERRNRRYCHYDSIRPGCSVLLDLKKVDGLSDEAKLEIAEYAEKLHQAMTATDKARSAVVDPFSRFLDRCKTTKAVAEVWPQVYDIATSLGAEPLDGGKDAVESALSGATFKTE